MSSVKPVIRAGLRHYGRCPVPHSDEPSMTKQSFKDECDINTIMRRFEATGMMPQPVGEPRYLDVSSVDYHAAMMAVANARSMFNELPSRVRDRFENDPHKLLAFLEDDKNVEEARELGLVAPAAAEAAPVAVKVVGAPEGAPVAAGEDSPKGRK